MFIYMTRVSFVAYDSLRLCSWQNSCVLAIGSSTVRSIINCFVTPWATFMSRRRTSGPWISAMLLPTADSVVVCVWCILVGSFGAAYWTFTYLVLAALSDIIVLGMSILASLLRAEVSVELLLLLAKLLRTFCYVFFFPVDYAVIG